MLLDLKVVQLFHKVSVSMFGFKYSISRLFFSKSFNFFSHISKMDFSIIYLSFILDSQPIFKLENSFSENFLSLNELFKSNEILSNG